MNNIEALIKTALVGTSKSNFRPKDHEELKNMGFDSESMNTQSLLELAAIYNKWEKIGKTLSKYSKELPAACPKDTALVASEKSTGHLQLILKGRFKKALHEYLYHMIKAGKRLSDETLPDILWYGLQEKKSRLLIYQVLGKKGEWLIQQNEEWNCFEIQPNEDAWEYGNLKERTNYLTWLRKENPTLALEKLMEVWAMESGDGKIKFLGCLEIRLSLTDEIFLTQCLDEKRKDIRLKAVDLLSQLPESKLCKRMESRLEQFIVVKKSLLKATSLEITLPDLFATGLKRDGIFPNIKGVNGGLKAGLLSQLISKTPPLFWENLIEEKPIKILEIFAKNEWAETMIDGVSKAIIHQNNMNWKYAILSFWIDNRHLDIWKGIDFQGIIMNLEEADFNRLAISVVKRTKNLLQENQQINTLLLQDKFAWKDELTFLIIQHFQKWLQEDTQSFYGSGFHFRAVLENASYRINPLLNDQISKSWPVGSSLWKQWESQLDKFQGVLAFRKSMIKEIYQK